MELSSYTKFALAVTRFLCTVYYLCSIIFRLSFRQEVQFSKDLWFILLLDYFVDAVFWVDLGIKLYQYSSGNSQAKLTRARSTRYMKSDAAIAPEPSDTSHVITYDLSVKAIQHLLSEVDATRIQSGKLSAKDKKSSRQFKLLDVAVEFLSLMPFEVIGFLLGYRLYYLLRVPRLIKMRHILQYWSLVIRHFEQHEILTGPSSQRVLSITVFMVVLAHLGACAFYALAVGLMKHTGIKDTWLTNDGIVEFNGNELVFTRSLAYRYVRAIYWSVVTEQTVGFGDVVPISVYETCFCICYFYLSLLLALLSIGNLILLFNVFDSARTKYTEQASDLKKYAEFRSLPAELTDRIKSFYFHQWKILNGLDESELMEELPQNIKSKIKQSTVRKYLKNIKRFRNFQVSLLNALTEDIRVYMYSPHDVIVAVGTKARGMYIVSRGEAFLHTSANDAVAEAAGSTHNASMEGSQEMDDDPSHVEISEEEKKAMTISQALRQGEAYGVRALFEHYVFSSTLSSGACVSEILYLSRSNYRRTCRLQLDDDEFTNSTIYAAIQKAPSNLGQRSGIHRAISTKHSHIAAAAFQVEEISRWNDLMKPSSQFRECWDLVIFTCLLFYSITLPLLLADALYEGFYQTHEGIIILGFIVDFAVFADLCFRCSCFSYVHESILFAQPRDIFNNFVGKNNIIVEVIRHFPFSVFTPLLGERYLVVLRLGKMLHFGRIGDYSDRAEKTATRMAGRQLSFTSRRFMNLYFALFMLCHWVGCLWQLVADASTEIFGYSINWKIQDRDSEFLHMEYDGGLHGFSAYRRGIYWSINGMATTGTADMPSTNMVEMIFCCVVLVGGCQTINALLGSIASLMATINMDKRRFEEKMKGIKKLLRFKNVPKELELKILFSHEYRFSKTSGINETEILGGLPQPLREACVKFVAGSVLIKIPFFTNCAEPMLEMILGLLHHRLFLDGDAVVLAGEYGKDMFIIESGHIIVTSPDKKTIYANLVSGDYIGESCLLKVTKRSASAYATDYSDVYILQKDDFQKVLDSFPTESEAVVEGIKNVLAEKIRKNNSRSKKNEESDPKASMPFSRITSVLNIQNSEKATSQKLESVSEYVGIGSYFKSWSKELEEGSHSRKIWDALLFGIVMYNVVMVPLRLALDIDPVYFALDYMFDGVLLLDAYMKATMFRRIVGGRKLVEADQIRAAYLSDEVKLDLPARFPYELFVVFILPATASEIWYMLKILRIPKLFLTLKSGVLLDVVESLLTEMKIPFVTLRLVQVLIACILVGHYLGCGLYLFSKVHLGDCVPEPGAMYGTACEFRNLWPQFLIWGGKLGSDGGSQLSRYIRTLEWAIPTMMLYVVGDVYPMNMDETSYVYGAMFFGITINAMIVGSIISLVTTLDEDRAVVATQLDVLKEHLTTLNVTPATIQKVSDYLKFLLTDTGQLMQMEQEVISDLPYSLQVAVNEHTKMKYFNQCKFFDFCEDNLLKRLCMRLSKANYYTGDMIVHFGDLGQEMYFVESGVAEVVSTNLKTVFAKINAGGFFGETGLVFRSRRTANIRAATICSCYILTKEDFDSELQGCNVEQDAPQKSLNRLTDANKRMNLAVTKNLSQCVDPSFKLSKVIGPIKENQDSSRWKQFVNPNGVPKLVLDVIGLLLLSYYMFTIPFEVAFLFGDHVIAYTWNVMPVDLVVDLLCIVELVLRVWVFPLGFQELERSGSRQVALRLYRTRMDLFWDVVASIPLEILTVIPLVGIQSIGLLRLVHLCRIMNFFPRLNQVEAHLVKHGLSWHRTTIMVVKSILVYTIANHWTACVFFLVHRYERNVDTTWVVEDGYATMNEETGEHDICNTEIWKCYQRAVYFMATVLTSVGYGDISPYTDAEMISMQILSIIGGVLGANLAGQLMTYLSEGDKCGEGAFKEKLRSVENYIRYRGLGDDVRSMILLTYHTMWTRERRTDYNKHSFLGLLSKPLAAEVALELNAGVLDMMVITKHCRPSLHGRIASTLRPQIFLPSTQIYNLSDTGHSVFFIYSGNVRVKIGNSGKNLDASNQMAQTILSVKHSKLGENHTPGAHFGEFCLLSQLGLRLDDAVATEVTETYSFEKAHIWSLFRSMPFVERYRFILSLFTETGSVCYAQDVIPSEDEEGKFDGDSIKILFAIAGIVAEDVVESLDDSDSDSSGSDEDEHNDVDVAGVQERRKQRRLMSVVSNFSETDECLFFSLPGGTNRAWLNALMSFDKSKIRRRSTVNSVSRADMQKMRRQSRDAGAAGTLIPKTMSTVSAMMALLNNEAATEDELRAGISKQVNDMFLYMDKDQSGKIDRNELMLSLFDIGIEKSWNEVDSMISSADADSDNLVSLEELTDVVLFELKQKNAAPVSATNSGAW